MGSKYKPSRYNVFFEYNKHYYLWNTLSGAFIAISKYEKQNILNNFNDLDTNSNFFNNLYNNGCIVKAEYDELGKILFDEKACMMNVEPQRMGFTIVPGLGCNYNCYYCFENENKSNLHMTEEVQNNVYEFICNSLSKNRNVKKCQITWFGGEPLLYIDTIVSISRKLIIFCNKNNIKYNAGIITNGRFLSIHYAKLLKECLVTQAQITVDGLEDIYCKYKGATPQDFQAVIDNIVNASSMLKITIRVNIDFYSEINDVLRFTNFLLKEKKLDGKVRIYVGFIRDYGISRDQEILNHGKYIDNLKNYLYYFGTQYKYSSFGQPAPRRRLTSCLQVCYCNLCIGPLGELYRCEHYFGQQNAIIGTVNTGRFYNRVDIQYFQCEHNPKCLLCEFFPVCLGGCLDDKVNDRLIINCDKYKDYLIEHKVRNVLQNSH